MSGRGNLPLCYNLSVDDFKKRTIFSAGIILGSFVASGLIMYWLSGVMDAKATDVAADRRIIADRTYALENLSALKNRVAIAEQYAGKISALLPNQDGLLSFPQFLEEKARLHNISVNFSFSGEPVVPSADIPGSASFSASASESPQEIRNFIDDLEFKTTKFLVSISTLTFIADAGGSRADVTGVIYFQ